MHAKVLLIIIFYISFVIAQKNFCVVLDIVSDGSVSKNSCSLLSQTIDEILILDGRYKLFDRKILPELLEQYSLYELSQECYSLHCLTEIGKSIGADIIIGGKAVYKDKRINIELNMIDAKQKRKIQTISINTQLSKKKVVKEEIPIVVKMLLDSETSYQLYSYNRKKPISKKVSIKERNLFYKNVLLYTGAIFAGGMSAIICYYILDKKEKKIDDKPLSMDDLPQRTRHTE